MKNIFTQTSLLLKLAVKQCFIKGVLVIFSCVLYKPTMLFRLV